MPLDFSILNQNSTVSPVSEMIKQIQANQDRMQRERQMIMEANLKNKQLDQEAVLKREEFQNELTKNQNNINATMRGQDLTNEYHKNKIGLDTLKMEDASARGWNKNQIDQQKADQIHERGLQQLEINKDGLGVKKSQLELNALKLQDTSQRGWAGLEQKQSQHQDRMGLNEKKFGLEQDKFGLQQNEDARKQSTFNDTKLKQQIISQVVQNGGSQDDIVEALYTAGFGEDASKLEARNSQVKSSFLNNEEKELDITKKKDQAAAIEAVKEIEPFVINYAANPNDPKAAQELDAAIAYDRGKKGLPMDGPPSSYRMSYVQTVSDIHNGKGLVKPSKDESGKSKTNLEKLQTYGDKLQKIIDTSQDPAEVATAQAKLQEVNGAITKTTRLPNPAPDITKQKSYLKSLVNQSQQNASQMAQIASGAAKLSGSALAPGGFSPEGKAEVLRQINSAFGTNFQSGNIALTEAIKAIHGKMAINSRAPGSGSTSDLEFQTYLDRNPGMGWSPQGIAKMNEWIQYEVQANESFSSFYDAYVDAHQNKDTGWEYAWRKFKSENPSVSPDGSLNPAILWGWQDYVHAKMPSTALDPAKRKELEAAIAEKEGAAVARTPPSNDGLLDY